jgi:hypothetical protein
MGRGEGIGMATIDPAWWTSGSYQTQPMSEILASRDFGKVFGWLPQVVQGECGCRRLLPRLTAVFYDEDQH